MFDHGGVKIAKKISSLSILFLHVKSKNLVTKKYEDKGPNMASLKIYSKLFLNKFLM